MRGKLRTMLTWCLELFRSFLPKLQCYVTTQKKIVVFLPGGRVGPDPFTRVNKVEKFLVETLVLHTGFLFRSVFFPRYNAFRTSCYIELSWY
jgi:hypothetical protein